MSRDTDETARAIAETKLGEEHWGFCEAGVEFADLQRMARLWLMRDEIIGQLEGYDNLADVEAARDLLKRIAEVKNGGV